MAEIMKKALIAESLLVFGARGRKSILFKINELSLLIVKIGDCVNDF
jgi:hypothetical protein